MQFYLGKGQMYITGKLRTSKLAVKEKQMPGLLFSALFINYLQRYVQNIHLQINSNLLDQILWNDVQLFFCSEDIRKLRVLRRQHGLIRLV